MRRLQFKFIATVHLAHDDAAGLAALFPEVSEAEFSSKEFDDITDCSKSCMQFMTDLAEDLNLTAGEHRYAISIEQNPLADATKKVGSTNWTEDMVAKVWVFAKDQVSQSSILAIGQGTILQLHPTGSEFLLN